MTVLEIDKDIEIQRSIRISISIKMLNNMKMNFLVDVVDCSFSFNINITIK